MTQVFSMALYTTRRIFLGAFLSVIHACSAAGTWIDHGINYGNAPPIQKVGGGMPLVHQSTMPLVSRCFKKK